MRSPLERLLWENRRLFRSLAAAADEALVPLGIQASQRALLEFLAGESEPIGLSEVARKHSISRQHVHQVLARLPNPDWVDRLADPDDARSVRLRLSGEGRAMWRRIRTLDRRILRRLAGRVSDAEIESATATIQTLRRAVGGDSQ